MYWQSDTKESFSFVTIEKHFRIQIADTQITDMIAATVI